MGRGRGGSQPGRRKAERDLAEDKFWLEREEGYLERVRTGYTEGTKLFFELFRTQALLTTGTILAIVALSNGLLELNSAWNPLLWASYFLLLGSIVLALRTMEQITIDVLNRLTQREISPRAIRAGQITSEEEEERLQKESDESNRKLKWRSRLAWSGFLMGVLSFLMFVILPVILSPSAEVLGLPLAIVLVVIAAALVAYLYRRM